ncbi:hypothetical protein HK103_002982 [Boothiomyces macroporosus]|uniref:Serine protease n=1 Tax=Boothiomyces macroporosus TaxID=261099 RepID=A0AAD5UIH2_9FUNG|nr:hypothetical protein HK103_002982 [Boothiomyces macroporosus]
MSESFLLKQLKSPICQEPNSLLHPHDKLLLKKSYPDIISDLNQFLYILSSYQTYIKLHQRKSLVICIRLAQNLGYEGSADVEKLVLLLNRPIRKNNYNIKKEDREAIIPFLKFLIDNLSKLKEINFKTELEKSTEKLENLKINNTLSQSFVNKLDCTDFDNMFDIETGGINDKIWNVLEDAGAWKAGIDLGKGKIIVNGENSEVEFMNSIASKNIIPNNYIEYHQESPPRRNSRDDVCSHAGCKIKFDDAPHLFYDYRSDLAPLAKEIIAKYNTGSTLKSPLGGTIGLFVNRNGRHYLVTAAHNLFPELSKMKPDDLNQFNQLVSIAHYDQNYDIGMIEIGNNSRHDNGLVIAPTSEWNFLAAPSVFYKLGGRTGLTIGDGTLSNLEKVRIEGFLYSDVIMVSPSNLKLFATEGENGSIYYVEGCEGFVPVAIHRSSDKNGSYGGTFLKNFKKILEKKGLGDIDEFKPCQENSRTKSFNECNGCHTTYFGPRDIN